MDLTSDLSAIAKLASAPKKRIGAGSLASGGKFAPGKAPGKLPSADEDDEDKPKKASQDVYSAKSIVKIAKANDERRTVTGVVLQPEETDGQGDIISVDVIANAAHSFLAAFNKKTKLGLQHKDFKKGRFDLVESHLAPIDMAIGSSAVKAGSWIMTVKVLDGKIWQAVKDGKVTGFSIGGVAKVQQLKK